MHHKETQEPSSSSLGRAVANQGPLLLSPSGNLRQPMESHQSLDEVNMETSLGLQEMCLTRGLYGGAIEIELPLEFEDISSVRDVRLALNTSI